MEYLECTQCGSAMANGLAVCGACGKEINETGGERPPEKPDSEAGRKKIYAFLAVVLVVLGGVALLIFSDILPNFLPGEETVAVVNGEKISAAEVNRKLETYKKNYNKSSKRDFSTPEGEKFLKEIRKQIVTILIQERILLTEAAKAKITVSPKEIADRIAAMKKGLNLSDDGFRDFLKNNSDISLSDFEKRIEREFLINKLIESGTKRGLKKDAWVDFLMKRAKVEVVQP